MSSAEEARIAEARGPRNGRLNPLAGRDTAIFTQMRRNARGPRGREFFTDSTNTSFIPSPRASVFAKPRQAGTSGVKALNGTRAAASDETNKEKENDIVESSPATAQERSRSRASSNTRSPIHISAAGSPIQISVSNRTATRTPSPPRGREERPSLISPASFVSESSEPPHALPEIYRRIEDEESIAGASDVSSSARGSPSYNRTKRLSLSPTGLRSSSVQSLSPQLQAQEVEVKPETTQQPSPPLSSPDTGRSSLFEETVETDPEMLARDERRVREAINSDTRAFSKARKGRANLTSENLRRQDAGGGAKNADSSQSHSSGRKSEPSLNVPTNWGGKARNSKRWLKIITRDRQGAAAETATAEANGVNVSEEPDKATKSVKDWLQGATASPIVEVEEPTSDSQNRAKQALRERTSFDKARQWESHRRYETLSPPKSTASLAALRERSIERLEKSAVATSRLGALGDSRTLQKKARKSSGQLSRDASEAVEKEPSPTSDQNLVTRDLAQSDAAPNEALLEPHNDENKENSSSIPGKLSDDLVSKPLVQPHGPVSPEVAKQLAFAVASQPKSGLDSHDLLRRFSRASSSSPVSQNRATKEGSSQSNESDGRRPSPLSLQAGAISKPEPTSNVTRLQIQAAVANAPRRESSEPRATITQPSASVEPKMAEHKEDDFVVVQGPATLSEKAKGKLPESRSEIEGPKTASNDTMPVKAETPQVPRKAPDLKTPKVTGGWIDTPTVSVKKLGVIPEHMPDRSEQNDQESVLEATRVILRADKAQKVDPRLQTKIRRDLDALAQTAPPLPGSALAAIIDHAKRKNRGEETSEGEETLQLDEGTIRSLEKLLVKDEDSSNGHQSHHEDETMGHAECKPDTKAVPGEARAEVKLQPTKQANATSAKEPQVGSSGVSAAIKPDPVRKTDDTPSSTEPRKPSEAGEQATSDPLPQSKTGKPAHKPSLTIAIQDSPKQTTKPKSKKPKKSVAVVAPEETCDQAGEFHDFIWPCEACRKRAKALAKTEDETIGVVQWQTIQIPRLWTWSGRLPRLSKLGWCILIVSLCVWAESEVSSYYTPPFYAMRMEGFGVDYDMVRPPFVIPKLIWRGPVGDGFRWIGWLFVMIVDFVTGVLGVDLSVFQRTPPPPKTTKWIFKPAYETYRAEVPVGADHMVRQGGWLG